LSYRSSNEQHSFRPPSADLRKRLQAASRAEGKPISDLIRDSFARADVIESAVCASRPSLREAKGIYTDEDVYRSSRENRLDTNVLVAAHASHGLAGAVFELCSGATIVVSTEILRSWRRFAQEDRDTPIDRRGIIEFLQRTAEVHKPLPIPAGSCRTRMTSTSLVGCRAHADRIITGDEDLLALGSSAGSRSFHRVNSGTRNGVKTPFMKSRGRLMAVLESTSAGIKKNQIPFSSRF